jgi:hypothetical protein
MCFEARYIHLPPPPHFYHPGYCTSDAASADVTQGQFLFIDYLLLASSFPLHRAAVQHSTSPPPSIPALSQTTLSHSWSSRPRSNNFSSKDTLSYSAVRRPHRLYIVRGARRCAWSLYFISTSSLKRDRVVLMPGCTSLAINVRRMF